MCIDKYLLESEINMNNDRMKRVRPTTQSLMNKLPTIHPGEKLPANELRMRLIVAGDGLYYWDSRKECHSSSS